MPGRHLAQIVTWAIAFAITTVLTTVSGRAMAATSAPGGVAGAALWFAASDYTGAGWPDRSGSGLVTAAPVPPSGAATPAMLAQDANFYPGVSFNGSSQWLRGSTSSPILGGANTYIFGVQNFSGALTGPQPCPACHPIGGVLAAYPNSGQNAGQGLAFDDAEFLYFADAAGNSTYGPFGVSTGGATYVLADTYYPNAALTGATAAQNALVGAASTATNAVYSGTQFEIGGRTAGGYTMRLWSGSIDEIVMYQNTLLTATQIAQIRSYLALKYGITLGFNTSTNAVTATNYLSSAGTTIWSATANPTYTHDVAGIGKDANSGLDQRVAHSTNPAINGNTLDVQIANGATLSTTSQAANTPFSADQTFVMWGDNGGAITLSTIGGIDRMSRVWRAQATGSGSTQLTVAIPAAALSGVTHPGVLIAADPNFGTNLNAIALTCGTTYCSAVIPTFAATATSYFSFGAIPGTSNPTPTPAPTATPGQNSSVPVGQGLTYIDEGFSASATTAKGWSAIADACLTAGTPATTPTTSVPACGTKAPQDSVGQGALQLTNGAVSQAGMVIWKTPLSTKSGLQITFDDYAFNGTSPGSEGIAFFLTDASKPIPTAVGQRGAGLGYSGLTTTGGGLANAYLGVGIDEYGGFSNSAGGYNGGPGQIAESIAARGSAATGYQYLGGAQSAAGKPASLPFALDQPTSATRPTNAPTIRATLTSSGVLTVAVDHHDGNGFVTYYSQSIVGVGGQPAVPANVYFGLSASTGTHYETHQVSGVVVSAIDPPATALTPLVNESFTHNATTASLWAPFGDACLTAGTTTSTPTTSVSACGSLAPVDAAGSGALLLNASGVSRYGAVIEQKPLPTIDGLQITFNDYAFNGTNPGGEGLAFFLADASQAFPTHVGQRGAGIAYSGTTTGPGLPGGYLGVALDESGGFSSSAGGYTGGPAVVPETIAARGAASSNYQYLGGATNANGKAASLPFALDTPTLTTRPATAPTVRATLTPAGTLTVAIDRHDGNGYVVYYTQSIVGVGGQPAVPASVYFGLGAATGSHYQTHEISNLTITTATGVPVTTAVDNPPQLVSANGSLVFNVSVVQNANTGNPQYVYNGSMVAPTLRLLPGDTLTVNLTNKLPTPPSGSGYSNTTNMHFHGLHVTPQAPGDDSIDMLAAPGQSLHYALTLPTNHPPGLYWYHSHAHGEAERQTLSGMSGAIIVDGIAAYTPQVTGMLERVLVVRDAPLPGGSLPNARLSQLYAMKWAMQHGVTMHASGATSALRTSPVGSAGRSELHTASNAASRNPYAPINPQYRRFIRSSTADSHCVAGSPEQPVHAITLNGQTQPTLNIAPGENQFWRVGNASADTYIDFAVDNTRLQLIAIDGVPLSSGVNTPASLTLSHFVIPPASRAEFIVTGPPAGTTAYVRTNCFDSGPSGNPMPAEILATINPIPGVASTAQRALVARVSPRATRFRFNTTPTRKTNAASSARIAAANSRATAARILATPISATQTIYYSDQNDINGVIYNPAAPPAFYAQSGTVQQWTIQNNSYQVHTFHIHQIHFVVQAINGVPQSQQFVWDNVNVPAATASGPGTVTLLLDFTDPLEIGTFLLHCHILAHEDAGMMAKIRVGTTPPLSLSASSATFKSPSAAAQTVTIAGGAAPYSLTGCNGVANASVNGTKLTITPSGAGTCVLTVADSSTPSSTATISIQVAAAPPSLSLGQSSVSFSAPGVTGAIIPIIGGTAPFSVSGCPTIVSTAIVNNDLVVAPQAVGTCTLTLTDANGLTATLSVSVNSPTSSGSSLDNLTFHGNAGRTGWYSSESTLTTSNVNGSSFGQIATLGAPAGMPALGKVYAQPLFATNELAVDGNHHNLVIVAGAAGQVYAFDESTHAVVWERSFTNPGAGIRQQLWSDTGCADINPDVGIIGTPVIDRSLDRLFVVVATMENGVPYTRLHAIGLGNGNDVVSPTVIGGTVELASGGTASISSLHNMNRSALLEANSNIYVALGSHCDADGSSVHGWVLAYSASSLQETGSLVDLTNANSGSNFFLGSVWMGGFGPAADSSGNVYFATGNGPFDGVNNFSMSVMKVPGNLNLGAASYFTPIQEYNDSQADADLGAGGVIVLPDQNSGTPHIAIAGGKCSTNGSCYKYILNRDALGGQQNGNAGALWSGNTGGGMWGGPAYFVDANGTPHIVYGTGGPLNTYNLNLAPFSLSVQSSANVGCLECRNAGSQPIVSSNGTQNGSAIVWALKTPGNSGGTITLYAFNALNMSSVLFSASAGSWNATPGASYIGGALISPLVVDGRVYVPSDGAVSVFGLH